MSNDLILVKIGGKILEKRVDLDSTISQLKVLIEKKIFRKIIIIPGGGSLANFIRGLDDKLKIGDDLAHWAAIYAMDYNGIELSKNYSDLELTNDFIRLQNRLIEKSNRFIIIFLPFNFLHQNDELPHRWEVTSDSITLHLACKLNLKECFLIKDVDGIYIKDQSDVIQEISTKEYRNLEKHGKLAEIQTNIVNFKRSKPIDNYMLTLIGKYEITCVILNGTASKSRILNFFTASNQSNKAYTKIKHT